MESSHFASFLPFNHCVVSGRSTILKKIMDILLFYFLRYFYPCPLLECIFGNLPVFITIEMSFLVLQIKSRTTSIYVVLNTVFKGIPLEEVHSSERTGTDFSAVRLQSHQPARVLMFFHQKHEMNSSEICIEGTSSLVTFSPTLVDPALVSVIRAVDGQDTGLSAQPAEQPTSDRHRPGLSSSKRTGPGFSAFKASAGRPA